MRSEGRVFKRGQVVWIANYARGREYRESAGRSEREAEELLRRRIAHKIGGAFIGPEEERVTVRELLDSLAVHLETKGAKSLVSFKSHVKPIRAAFADLLARDLSSARVEAWQRQTDGEWKILRNVVLP